jgi:poly-gamma-glutamate capsule biosynthesis protein CapA/YwtB (metallophosphatase superfamily)
MEIRINIAGDFAITQSNYDTSYISNDVIELFDNSDLNILNLECQLTNATENDKILKTGPYLKGNEEAAFKVLSALKTDMVTMANNHIMDYGERGLSDTLESCKKHNIQTVGAGMNLEKAKQPARVSINGKNISIVNFAENEWASAEENSPGASPMNIIDNITQIKNEKKFSDFVIVIVHGGHMFYHYPSPNMQKQYRFYAENGADLVVCHHSHCISGYELYNNVPIYYGLGNFLFTKDSKFNSWYTGLVLQAFISVEGELTTHLIPTRMEKESFKISRPTKSENDQILSEISRISNIIVNCSLLKQQWEVFINSKHNSLLNRWAPTSNIPSVFIKSLLNRLGVNFLRKKNAAYYLNFLRCEAHYDLSIEVLKRYINNTRFNK